MSRIEGEFLSLALEIGLAEAIAETLRDIDRAMAELPPTDHGSRYRKRLEDQRASLRNPTLRTTAALVVDAQQVVLGETETTDGCLGLYPSVGSMPVVSM